MNGYTHYPNHSSLNRVEEFQSTPAPKNHEVDSPSTLKNVGRAIMNFLNRGNDLRVWTRQRHGQTIWHVYDPMTERRGQFSSEEDLRSWLETRYYV